ncbi:MAG TPA: MFS transporter [Candidatus Limnocylindrales bacterium]|nr:MFS transporter [Candidatus Limnocylindrales bacterium]
MSFTSPVTKTRWSDVYISSSVQLFGGTGAFLVMTTLVLGLQERGASGLQVAALIIAESLPMVVLGKLMGRMADRFDSRWLLVLAGVGQVAACQLLVSATEFGWVVAGGVALATATAVAGPTRTALLPAMAMPEDLPRANAIGQTANSMGMMAGPALAGLLVGTGDVQGTLQIASFGFLATIVAGITLRTRRGGARVASDVDSPSAAPAWKLRHDRMLWAVVWGMTLVIGSVSAVTVVLVFFIRGTLQGTATMYGLVDALWTTGVLGGAWLIARLIRPHVTDAALVRWMFLIVGLISGVVVLVGAAQAVLWLVPCYLVGGALNGMMNVIMGTVMGRRVPADARGRAAAALQSRANGGALVGFVLGGLLLEVVTPRWMILGAGLLGLLMVLLVTPKVLRVSQPASQKAHEPALV